MYLRVRSPLLRNKRIGADAIRTCLREQHLHEFVSLLLQAVVSEFLNRLVSVVLADGFDNTLTVRASDKKKLYAQLPLLG